MMRASGKIYSRTHVHCRLCVRQEIKQEKTLRHKRNKRYLQRGIKVMHPHEIYPQDCSSKKKMKEKCVTTQRSEYETFVMSGVFPQFRV